MDAAFVLELLDECEMPSVDKPLCPVDVGELNESGHSRLVF